jgi:cell division septal protein FtsQ
VEHRRVRRRRLGVALAFLVGLPALAAGGLWGGRAVWRALFSENDFFEIRRIEVTTDGDLGMGHILEYAKVQKGDNLLSVYPRQVRESLLMVPVVAQAQVSRRLPDTLVIEVAERVAVARLGRAGSGSPLAVDSEGHVLGPSSVRASLPLILGLRDKGLRPGDVVKDPMLQDVLCVLEICNRSDMRRDLVVDTIDVSHDEYLTVGLMSGERVLLSRGGLEEKLLQFPVMRAVAQGRGLELAIYDMTVDRNYAGRPATWQDPSEEDGP